MQVTSTSKKNKIQETLDKLFDKKLNEKYDEIFILILGKKQKSYSAFKVIEGFFFDPERHVFDFKYILKFINALPTKRIEAIAKLLSEEDLPYTKKQSFSNSTKIKRNLALKKRLKKDLLRTLDREYWQHSAYEPWIKFKYDQAIFRSVDDKCWPDVDIKPKGPMSSWLKCNFWDFYDNGIELLEMGVVAIFDRNGYWDVLGWKDERENNNLYKKISCNPFLRIPYDYIVEYDMETDPYYGLPTIYVEYAKNGMPYEEILYGIPGIYEKNNFNKSRMTHYFDSSMRRKLE